MVAAGQPLMLASHRSSSTGSPHGPNTPSGSATFELEQRIDAYLDHLRVERALASNTLEAYARDLNKFVEFVATRTNKTGSNATTSSLNASNASNELTEVHPSDVAGFVAKLSRTGLSAR